MPSIILNSVSRPEKQSQGNNKILSFLEWNNQNIGISYSDAETQYNKYLNDYYKQTEVDTSVQSNKLKEDYINLLKRIQIIFQNDAEFQRYNNIDFTSETDLKLAIPLYARKLKEIASFYSKKREELKKAKLKYSTVGSEQAINTIIYNKLLSQFTKNTQVTFINENPLISQSPELSAIKDDFKIEVETLYDTNDYFNDSDQLNPLLCVFENICDGLFLEPLSAKADPLENLYICEPENQSVVNLLQTGYDKYLANNINFLSGGYYLPDIKNIDIPLEQGNNFFYWFSGKTVMDLPEGFFKSTNINDIDWTNATGSLVYSGSDLIFVNVGNILTDGAWLYQTDYINVTATLSATLSNGKYFKFPYPNLGTSGEGGIWSGPLLDDTAKPNKEFFPGEEVFANTQQDIQSLYWSNFSSISTVENLSIQDTTLKDNGAFAAQRFEQADKLIIRDYNPDNFGFLENNEIAWLYDFRETQLPIVPGTNNIYFPITTYESESDLFFNYNNGSSITLSSIDVADAFAGSVAGTTLSSSDMLVKLQTICGPEIEAAWLKAIPLSSFTNFSKSECSCENDSKILYTDWHWDNGGAQASLFFKANEGQYVRFVWTGDTTDINDVRGFTGFQHDDSCEYKYLDHSVSLIGKNFFNTTNQELFEKWKKCSCQAIQHSPFGHTANGLNNFGITPDFIIEDTNFPDNFNTKQWAGKDKESYLSSNSLARFYPTNITEKDMGWGEGTWKTNKGNNFILVKGKSYIFYRSNYNNCQFESPYFILNQKYSKGTINNENCEKVPLIPTWQKAVLDLSGNWVDAGVSSDMILDFGDFFKYNHQNNIIQTSKKLIYSGIDISTLSGEFITVDINDPNISYEYAVNTIPSINFIITIPLENSSYWAKGSFAEDYITNNKKISVNGDSIKIVNDYLQISQPAPSDIILSDKKYIEYNTSSCNECFTWIQPLNFQVYNPIKQWNKIALDKCVQSDILDYLHKKSSNCFTAVQQCYSDCDNPVCGCDYFCSPTRTSTLPLTEKSAILLNNELSGVPVYVNYFARQSFNLSLTAQDITNGEPPNGGIYVPIVTGSYVTAQYPWQNIINQKGSKFVYQENFDNLVSEKDINFYKPSRVSMNKFETSDSSYSTEVNNSTATSLYRDDNYFDYPFIKTLSNSENLVFNNSGKLNGNIKQDKQQSFIPYNTSNEQNSKEIYGLWNSPLSFSPWSSETGEWKESNLYKNFRNQFLIKCPTNNWFTDQLVLTGDVYQWQTDIFGNQYYLIFDELLNFNSYPTSYGKLYVKSLDGKVKSSANTLSALYSKYANIDLINISALNYSQTAQGIQNCELFYDTIALNIKSFNVTNSTYDNILLIDKISYNYDTELFESTKNSLIINFGNTETSKAFYTKGNTHIGNHLDQKNKEVYVLGLSSLSDTQHIPSIYNYNINKHSVKNIYPKESNVAEWSSFTNYNFVSSQIPISNYNNDQTIDILFKTTSADISYLNIINFQIIEDRVIMNDYKMLSSHIPEDFLFTHITNSLSGKLLTFSYQNSSGSFHISDT